MAACALTESLRRKLYVRMILANMSSNTISRQDFVALCTSSPHIPTSSRMTSAEANQFLSSLINACQVVPVTSSVLFLRPIDVVSAVHARSGIEHVCGHRNITNVARLGGTQKPTPVTRWTWSKQEFFAFWAFLSSLQMSTLAFFTFHIYGWDIMEPICFFLTLFTNIFMFAQFIYFRSTNPYHWFHHRRNQLVKKYT